MLKIFHKNEIFTRDTRVQWYEWQKNTKYEWQVLILRVLKSRQPGRSRIKEKELVNHIDALFHHVKTAHYLQLKGRLHFWSGKYSLYPTTLRKENYSDKNNPKGIDLHERPISGINSTLLLFLKVGGGYSPGPLPPGADD